MNFLKKNKFLIISTLVFFVVNFTFALIKFLNFNYNSLDLAIFSNVLAGDWFYSSIQQGSYLADHLTPILIFFKLDYFIFKSPITLIFYQIFFISLAVWPLYLISKHYLSEIQSKIIVLLYLLNPSIWVMSLFEFHLLPLAFFSIFFTYYFYLTKNFKWFTIFIFLSLMIREDVALFLLMLGVFIWMLEKNLNKFSKLLLIVSPIWFATSLIIINIFNNGYKYSTYYENFWHKIFNLSQLDLLFGLLAPFLFLPLLKIKYLLPGLLIYLQYLLLGGMGSIVLRGHYSVLLLISCFITLIYIFRDLNNEVWPKITPHKNTILVLLIIISIFSWFFWGPITELPKIIRSSQDKQIISEIQRIISPNSNIVSSYDLLPLFTKSKNLYSLHYVFQGNKQFSNTRYIIPPKTDYIIIDDRDFIIYELQSGHVFENDNIDKLLFDYNLVYQLDHYSVYAKKGSTQLSEFTQILSISREPGFYNINIVNGDELLKSDVYYFSKSLSNKDILIPEFYTEIKIQPINLDGYVTLNKVGMSVNVIEVIPQGQPHFLYQ